MKVRRGKSDDGTLEVQMAPLIDCVFLLLIFFLVATTMKKKERELEVELPDSMAATIAKEGGNVISLGVDADGKFYLDASPISMELLRKRIKEAGASASPPKIRIDADKRADYGRLVEILDLCQFEGLNVIGFRMKKLTGQ